MAWAVCLATFGCKLNQLETESLADGFRRAGALVLGPGHEAEADLTLVNTCTVTTKAEARARRGIRLAQAAAPDAPVLVTGCYAQLGAAELAALGPGVYVIPGSGKADLLRLPPFLAEGLAQGQTLTAALESWLAQGQGAVEADPFAFTPSSFSFHSRPSLKVEDGCDNRCSYCAVSLARGRAVSLDPGLALERLRELELSGAREAVLTGVNLSHYRAGGLDFPGLLRHLLSGTREIGLRLSSWEPNSLDPAFLEVFAEARIRPHLHLAVQSGSDSVLAAMARRYTAREVLAGLEALRRVRGDPFLSADLIAGFPGEGEAEFQETLDFLKAASLAWVHSFSFSPRPGTPAATMGPQVPERVAGARVMSLNALAEASRREYAGRWQGKTVSYIVEGLASRRPGEWVRGTSENYLRLALPSARAGKPGSQGSCVVGPSPEAGRFDAGARSIDK